MSYATSARALRVVLALAGLLVMFTGVNIAFGGIFTLGWQGVSEFAQVTVPDRYLAQDSHVRFLGGVWLSIGAVFALAAIWLTRFQSALKFAMIATFVGGLARFSQMNLSVTLGQDVLGSLVAELVGMPLLYFWVSRVIKQSEA